VVKIAKESGLGWTRLEVDDATPTARDIKNDVTNFEFSIPIAVQEITGVDKFAIERLLLLADFSITMNGVFNDESNLSHDVLKTVASSRVTRTIGLTVSGQILNNECLITDYALNRSDAGELTWSAPAVLQSGTAPTWTT
jgi:hypothetical protein